MNNPEEKVIEEKDVQYGYRDYSLAFIILRLWLAVRG
jgi:hypothetical protein